MDGGIPWAVTLLQKGYRTIRLIDFHNFVRLPLFDLAEQAGDERQRRERPFDLGRVPPGCWDYAGSFYSSDSGYCY